MYVCSYVCMYVYVRMCMCIYWILEVVKEESERAVHFWNYRITILFWVWIFFKKRNALKNEIRENRNQKQNQVGEMLVLHDDDVGETCLCLGRFFFSEYFIFLFSKTKNESKKSEKIGEKKKTFWATEVVSVYRQSKNQRSEICFNCGFRFPFSYFEF
jgi:hypothetical protein